MTQEDFQKGINRYADVIETIKESAHQLHAHVNQTYGGRLPYAYHLDMVADSVYKYGHHVCAGEDDLLPLFFGAYYHDSIEDARLTYNDVVKAARLYMDTDQAVVAAEIVYALTNDKGRTRAERAGEKYYQGIRQTPYAPFVKLADRLANITYSCVHSKDDNARMKTVYSDELPHFLEAIDSHQTDIRFSLPPVMVQAMKMMVGDIS